MAVNQQRRICSRHARADADWPGETLNVTLDERYQ